MRTALSLAALATPLSALAAATAEPPMETAGVGTMIAFVVVCVLLVAGYVWMTNRSSKKEREEAAKNAR